MGLGRKEGLRWPRLHWCSHLAGGPGFTPVSTEVKREERERQCRGEGGWAQGMKCEVEFHWGIGWKATSSKDFTNLCPVPWVRGWPLLISSLLFFSLLKDK